MFCSQVHQSGSGWSPVVCGFHSSLIFFIELKYIKFMICLVDAMELSFIFFFFFSQPLTHFTTERKERESIIFHNKNILALLLLDVRDL